MNRRPPNPQSPALPSRFGVRGRAALFAKTEYVGAAIPCVPLQSAARSDPVLGRRGVLPLGPARRRGRRRPTAPVSSLYAGAGGPTGPRQGVVR